MANVSEKLKRIDTNVAEMRTALGLTNANPIEEVTTKVKDVANNSNNAKIKEVDSTGNLMKYITKVDNILVTSSATSLNSFFLNCSNLPKISFDKNSDFSNVTNMRSMFQECIKLTNLDVSGFNTSKVENMYGMFWGCSGLTTLDVSELDTSKVTSMGAMFYGCSGLTELNVSRFDTSKVKDMGFMFFNCGGLTELNVSRFDTSQAALMTSMFQGCIKLTNLDVSGFDTSQVTNMQNMFYGCSGLTTLDVSELDTSKVTNMTNMFYGCSGLTAIPALDCSSVTIISSILNFCRKLENIGGFINLGKNYSTTASAGYSNYTLDLSYTKATHDSLMNLINRLYDIATKGCNPQKLVLGSTLLAKLTSEEIAIATAKGWTVS